MRRSIGLFFVFVLVATVIVAVGCGRSGSSSQNPVVTTSISDPATCGAPQGAFSHIYVTITDVRINQSATAGDSEPSWVDLTPALKNNPVQVDLLGAANQCFLATLGSTGIPAGSYQQLRVILANNTAGVSNNKCGATANCAMLTSDLSQTPIALQLSSESQTGIKIPSGQMAGGQFTVKAGDTKDLNIDFNACASIVMQGNGMVRLKPVLHAGEVQSQSTATSIGGAVVDATTHLPIVGGTTVVALEQQDSAGVDRVVMETVTGSNGSFAFCPVPAGTYDVVVSAISGTGVVYAATVITGIHPGDSLNNVPLTAAGSPASISGMITTSTGSAGTSADLQLSALLPITVNSATVMITTPLAQQSAATATLSTSAGSCPAQADCANYTLAVPAANPSVGAFVSSSTGQTPTPGTGTVTYTIDAGAFVPGSAGVPDCTPSEMQTNQTNTNTPLIVAAGNPVTAKTLAFTSCQ